MDIVGSECGETATWSALTAGLSFCERTEDLEELLTTTNIINHGSLTSGRPQIIDASRRAEDRYPSCCGCARSILCAVDLAPHTEVRSGPRRGNLLSSCIADLALLPIHLTTAPAPPALKSHLKSLLKRPPHRVLFSRASAANTAETKHRWREL